MSKGKNNDPSLKILPLVTEFWTDNKNRIYKICVGSSTGWNRSRIANSVINLERPHLVAVVVSWGDYYLWAADPIELDEKMDCPKNWTM